MKAEELLPVGTPVFVLPFPCIDQESKKVFNTWGLIASQNHYSYWVIFHHGGQYLIPANNVQTAEQRLLLSSEAEKGEKLISALESIMNLPGEWNDAKQIARKALGEHKYPGMGGTIKAHSPSPPSEAEKGERVNDEMLKALRGVAALRQLIEYPSTVSEEYEGEAQAVHNMMVKVEAAIKLAEKPSPPTAQEKQGVDLFFCQWRGASTGGECATQCKHCASIVSMAATFPAPAAPDKGEEKPFHCIWPMMGCEAQCNRCKEILTPSVAGEEVEDAILKMPDNINYHNGQHERCDMFLGPCSCGATHTVESWMMLIINSSGDRGRKEWPSDEEINMWWNDYQNGLVPEKRGAISESIRDYDNWLRNEVRQMNQGK